VDYRVLNITINIKITLNFIDIVINAILLIDYSNRLKFIVIIVKNLRMLLKRYSIN
jgi:hypothetical protein